MLTEHLEYFSLTYKARSYAQAAKLVPMSLQGLIKSIRQLERHYGATLFTTDEHGVLVPTAYADELFSFCGKWEHNSRLLSNAFERIHALESHAIRLGACLGISGNLGQRFQSQLAARLPHIKLAYSEYNDMDCDSGLRLGNYDLAFTIAPYGQDFHTFEMFSDNFIFWVNRDNPLSEKVAGIELGDLESQNIALPGEGFKCFNLFIGGCAEQGIPVGQIFSTAEMFHIYNHALSNRGIGMGVQHLTNLAVFQHDEVVAIPFSGPPWAYGVSYLPAHSLNEMERMFLEYCIGFW
ncbi:MAG: LysR family transcriptional regulator [Eggerthellaceae bacterium]|jgi:DNA-binding transcriptional LysR family regulator|nr:LysR family transcriptional regulator [Eggerthellaceae bacterium]MDR2716188.1 LysR family transcriptional regulator [Coriobacteriaceae bacterium]